MMFLSVILDLMEMNMTVILYSLLRFLPAQVKKSIPAIENWLAPEGVSWNFEKNFLFDRNQNCKILNSNLTYDGVT